MRHQTEVLRSLFNERAGQWIPLPEIMSIAAQYNARIFTLRREGMNILNKTKIVNGIKHSWYKYETSDQLSFV